jgi:hypothetical protein
MEANRTFYTVHVVERMQRRGVIESSEKWRELSALPLPAQFFQEASSLATLTGSAVRYRLISLNPINKQNGPHGEFERKALEAVMAHPEQPYKGVGDRGRRAILSGPVCGSCRVVRVRELP